MKLNLGSGQNPREGYLNVDKFPQGNPDIVMDLEATPWTFDDNSVDEILLNHVLEHLGATVDTFFGIIKEMYRVCKNGATIQINVPHPKHDNFINDPTHVRIITPTLMGLFDKEQCLIWREQGAANSPLGLYLDVNFKTQKSIVVPTAEYRQKLDAKEITEKELFKAAQKFNNVLEEYRITLTVIK